MPVDNPRQNKHGWWGTLTIDKDTEPKGGLDVGELCIFIKTNVLSHVVVHGTFVLTINRISSLAAAKARFSNLPPPIVVQINRDLDLITTSYPNAALLEILEVDSLKSTPLTKKLNEYTRKLFTRDATLSPEDRVWIDSQDSDEIGKSDIEAGMGLT